MTTPVRAAPVASGAAVVAGFLGGAVAVFAVRESAVQDHSVLSGGLRQLVVTPQWAGAVAAVVAAVVLAVLAVRRHRMLAPIAGAAGALVLALPAWVPVAASPAVSLTGVGAGILVAAAAHTTTGRRPARAALVIGAVGTALFYEGFLWRTRELRWTLTSFGDPAVPATVPVVVAAATAIVIGGVAYAVRPVVPDTDRRGLVVAASLPVLFTVVYATLGSTSASTASWTLAVLLTGAAVLTATRWSGRADARFLMAAFAVAASAVNGLRYFPGSGWLVVGGVVVLGAGIALGSARPMPTTGIALLAAATLTGLWATDPALDVVPASAYAVLVPFAVGLTVASALPTTTAAAVTGALMPLTVTLFAVSAPVERSFFWSNGIPEDVDHPLAAVVSPSTLAVLVAAGAVAAATVAVARTRITARRHG